MNKDLVSKLALNIRVLSAASVEKAKCGHPGMPMGTADIAAVMWSEFLKFNPNDTEWLGRDRFVLSAGHGSALLYSLLHLFKFQVSMEDLKNFRQFGSVTPGHPEFGLTSGVEVTTGPLGQGFANGVGMALSAKLLAAKYKTNLLDHNIYGIVSDGDLMEGVASEAASLAGHLKLDNLIYVYDDNDISIGGHTDVCFTEDVPTRFKSYGWKTIEIDGHDLDQIHSALQTALNHTGSPILICAKTQIGFGSPNKVNTAGVHGAPLGAEELELAKKQLGWNEPEDFIATENVKTFCQSVVAKNTEQYNTWTESYQNWQKANPDDYKTFELQRQKEITSALEEELFKELSSMDNAATRKISGAAIQVMAKHLPGLVGGSADLEPSNNTLIKDAEDITSEVFSGRNIRFGVREHAMGSIANGLAYSKLWFPYTGTFLVFSDYMRPPMRLAALSHLQSLFIFTHDSYFVGEDGPTHQPIEHLSALRVIPNLDIYRPADGVETAACYIMALKRQDCPATLMFTRQNLPTLKRESNDRSILYRGAHIIQGKDTEDLVLIATGSEVSLAVDTAKLLKEKMQVNARVVSVPCLEIFQEQNTDYQESVIPSSSKKVLIEAGRSWGWGNVLNGDVLYITKEDYGASAPHAVLAKEFGFEPEAVAEKIKNTYL